VYEIAASVQGLSEMLESQVTTFAYPNGIPGMDFGSREEEVLRSNGIRMAFTTESRHALTRDNTLRIPRLGISDKESITSVKAKIVLGPAWSRVKQIAGTGEVVERRRLARALDTFCTAPALRTIQAGENGSKARRHLVT
jgi:hypothetical protein